ncbi:hypothetical protein BH11ACT4_BH11ACT4_17700 [soil metagenome]
MLRITDNAKTVIRRLVSRVNGTKRGGLRIGHTAGSDELSIELAPNPEATDEIVEQGGARVFIEEAASAELADKELDALIDHGNVQFTLRDRMRLIQ